MEKSGQEKKFIEAKHIFLHKSNAMLFVCVNTFCNVFRGLYAQQYVVSWSFDITNYGCVLLVL